MGLLIHHLKKPYGPLLPWCGLVLVLLVVLWSVRSLGVESAQQGLSALETEWLQARKTYQQHLQAEQAKKDLAQVWAALPEERDFAPLALGITDEAKQNRVTLPALSYKTETTSVPSINRGVLQGTMSGRYEDLRRFLYEIETAEELVYIEDLDLVYSAERQDRLLTFTIKIATYLKAGSR
ncbi:MAG TPA: type 4a pilus biogenesis protein PilO [Nitrospira sp.]|nr:type 4a pilus biogenesis protein PilO [Nitrospira sp.]